MLLDKAEAARSGSTEAEAASTPAKQLLPAAVGAGDLAAETDVSWGRANKGTTSAVYPSSTAAACIRLLPTMPVHLC